MKRYLFLFVLILIVGLALNAHAVLFTFSGSDAGGTGSTTMDFDFLKNTLTVTINNTSPDDLDGGVDGGNSPGISGFGFNLDPGDLTLESWELTAYPGVPSPDSKAIDIRNDWIMGDSLAGISLDYLLNNDGKADGMLFNPDAFYDTNNTLPGGSNDVYYTLAVLTMNFDKEVNFVDTDDPFSPFVRFQNVGLGGEGSLKVAPVPEPANMLLFGCGLIGLTVVGRKKLRINQR